MISLHYYFFFVCVFFFVFSSRTDRFFNLSCHLFSYPLSLKQTSSFTKIIFFFFTFLRIMFFFSLCVIWVLWTFQLWKCYRTGVRCYICNLCCTYGSGCLYIILCRTALNICGIHLRSNNRNNICLYCLQLRLLDTSFFFFFFFFCS